MMNIEFPIDATEKEGIEAIKYLLSEGYSTIEQLDGLVENASVIEDCIVPDNAPWIADDGYAEVEYDYDSYSASEVADEYVSDGDWGNDLSGSINVSVWRVGIDSDGEDCDVEEEDFDIDLSDVLDHSSAIRSVSIPRSCGDDPDDHDWTSEGEGGCSQNPGVWGMGGTRMRFESHCRCCGLHRTEISVGSQRNPGEGDSVEYTQLGDEEIQWHRENGSMDTADEEDDE